MSDGVSSRVHCSFDPRASALGGPLAGPAHAAPTRARSSGEASDPEAIPAVAGLHTQFGADAATQVTVSWQATQPVRRPRVYLARNGHEYERSADADTASYTRTPSPVRSSRSTTRGSPDCGRTPSTCTSLCTKEPHPSSGRSARDRRADYQDGGNSYVRGYSGGAQKTWLEKELRSSRADRDIDWIVVCIHQVVISTADQFNGADLGIRQEWAPLFDRYGVDLVVCGHEHHYERSHPIRGHQSNQTLTPVPVDTHTDVIDTSDGTVHMVIGGGGTSAPSNQLFFDPPQCRVIVSVGPPDSVTGKRPPVYVREDAPWSAVRNAANAYGFASFEVDPGSRPGGMTSIRVTYYDVTGPYGQVQPFESFTLRRPRSDAR